MAGNLLLVEDDILVQTSIARVLKHRGFSVASASSIRDARDMLRKASFDVVVVDRSLPDGDGVALCSERPDRGHLAFVILSGRDSEPDVLDGYAAAADLYLRKPMSGNELAAHIAALLRRMPNTRAQIGPVSVDAERNQVVFPDESTKRLARQEVTFLMRLAERPGQIVHRDSLVDAIWGTAEPDSNGLDVLAWRIRKKLGAHASLVETVRGGGYRLRIDRLS